MSFWTVPPRAVGEIPFFSAAAICRARRIIAVALIVIETLTRSWEIPSKSVSMSGRAEIETPDFPTSPRAIESVGSYPICVGRSNATERPVCPRSRRYRYRPLVSSAVAYPAYWRMVQPRFAYMSG